MIDAENADLSEMPEEGRLNCFNTNNTNNNGLFFSIIHLDKHALPPLVATKLFETKTRVSFCQAILMRLNSNSMHQFLQGIFSFFLFSLLENFTCRETFIPKGSGVTVMCRTCLGKLIVADRVCMDIQH